MREIISSYRLSKSKYSNLEDNYIKIFFQSKETIPKNVILYDVTSVSIEIDQLIKEKKLVLIFPSDACTSCFNRDIFDYVEKILGLNKLIVVTSFDQFHSVKRDFLIDYNLEIYSLNDNEMKWFSTIKNQPTFLTIDKRLNPENHFIFDRNNSEIVKRYFDAIASIYFNR